MKKVSIICPVYNEICFIEKSLQTAIGEADEIILADNASTDGTSDVCQSFANKYKEIKYFRHKENKGLIYNHRFAMSKSVGKYTRMKRTRDLIYKGSTQKMLNLLEGDKEAVACFQRNRICINENGEVEYFHRINNIVKKSLVSADPEKRICAYLKDGMTIYVYLGLVNGNFAKSNFSKLLCCSDHSITIGLMAFGKVILEETTPEISITDAKYTSWKKHSEFTNSKNNLSLNVNNFAFISLCGTIEALKYEKTLSADFKNTVYERVLNNTHSGINLATDGLPINLFPITKKHHKEAIQFMRHFYEIKYPKALLENKLYVWGIGEHSINVVLPILKDDNLEVTGFLDSKANTKTSFCGNPVYLPKDILPKIKDKNAFIVIASNKFAKEMKAECKKYGLKENKNFIVL